MRIQYQISQRDRNFSPEKHWGYYKPPWVNFGTRNSYMGVQYYRSVWLQSIIPFYNIPYLDLIVIHA